MANLEIRITEIELFQEGPTRVDPVKTFRDAGLHPAMLKNIELAGYQEPTPIQRYCLPAIHLGHDVIAIAQTGEQLISFSKPQSRISSFSQVLARRPPT